MPTVPRASLDRGVDELLTLPGHETSMVVKHYTGMGVTISAGQLINGTDWTGHADRQVN